MPTFFRAEEQLFTNKTDWTVTEMQEWVDSAYGENHIEKVKASLEQLLIDAENGVIKQKQFHDFNGVSAKAYANTHSNFFYGTIGRYTYSDSPKYLYIRIAGEEKRLDGVYEVRNLIETLNNLTLDNLFTKLSNKYKDLELKWAKENADKIYFEENRLRIYNGELCYAYLRELELCAVPHVDISEKGYSIGFSTTYNNRTSYSGYHKISQNKHGELTYNGEVVPEDKVVELLELTKEFSAKTIALAKEHERLMNQILKGGEK